LSQLNNLKDVSGMRKTNLLQLNNLNDLCCNLAKKKSTTGECTSFFSFFSSGGGRSLNPQPCIYYALSTELSSRGCAPVFLLVICFFESTNHIYPKVLDQLAKCRNC